MTPNHILEYLTALCLKDIAVYVVADINGDLLASSANLVLHNIMQITKSSQLINKLLDQFWGLAKPSQQRSKDVNGC